MVYILEVIPKIIKLTEKYIKNKKNTNQTKKPDNFVEKFRQDHGVLPEDASDNDIIKYLNIYKGNEKEAYKAIMQKYSQ